MKMARASKHEIQACNAFAQNLESLIEYGMLADDNGDDAKPDWSDERLGKYVRAWCEKYSLFRVVFGYQVLLDNCCDPDATTLEWRKDLAEIVQKLEGDDEDDEPDQSIESNAAIMEKVKANPKIEDFPP